MSISFEKMSSILGKFALFFPAPVLARESEFTRLWCKALADQDEEQIDLACISLLQKLKRFPFPADFREEISVALVAQGVVAGAKKGAEVVVLPSSEAIEAVAQDATHALAAQEVGHVLVG